MKKSFCGDMFEGRPDREYLENLHMMWSMHFGNIEPGAECCFDCVDYKIKACAGKGFVGDQCLGCMDDKIEKGEIIFS